MYKAILFDLDGVLTNTSEYHYLAWKKLADELGIPFSRKFGDKLRGVSRRESLAIMLQGRIVSEAVAETFMDRKNAYYKELLKTMTKKDVLPGVIKLLTYLKKRGIKVVVASVSKNAKDVLRALDLEQYIDGIADGYSVEKHKPYPDIFLYAAKLGGCKSHESVVVEDAAAGVEAAHRAGMKCIGVGRAATGADKVFRSIASISPAMFHDTAKKLTK